MNIIHIYIRVRTSTYKRIYVLTFTIYVGQKATGKCVRCCWRRRQPTSLYPRQTRPTYPYGHYIELFWRKCRVLLAEIQGSSFARTVASYCRGLFLRKCRLLLAEIKGCFCGCTWNVINCQASIHAEVELFIRLATTVYGSRCRVLQCVSVCYNVLQWLIRMATTGRVLKRVAVCCSLLQSVAVCCILLQSVAVCIDVLQLLIQSATTEGLVFSVMQCIAVCCSVLLYVAVICKVSQCVAVCSSCWSVWLLDRAHSAEMKCSLDGNIGLC